MNIRHFLYVLVILVAAMYACRNPLDGVTIGLKDPIQAGVVESHFYDPAGNPLPTDSQVKVAGPNADQVVTTVNTTHYRINKDGVLLVAASPFVTPSVQQPFRFSIVAEAPDYLTIIQPIVMTNSGNQTRYIRWINRLKPPRTVAAAQSNGQASVDGLVSTSWTTTTTQTTSDGDRSMVVIPAGTRLRDRDGQPVGGDLTLAVVHTNVHSDISTTYIPGGGVMSNVESRNGGTSLGTFSLLSLGGSITMQLYNSKYALATTSSQPIPWLMDLNPNTYNPDTGRSIQAGDSIPLFSYDDYTNHWKEEKPGVVVYNPHTTRLEYWASAPFVGAYVATWTKSICAIGPIFTVNSRLTTVDVNYLCKLIDVTNGQPGQPIGAFYANVNNGAFIPIYNQLKNRKLKLQVFDETDAWGKGANGGLIAESAPGLTCDQTPVSINLSGLPIPPVVTVEFYFACPAATALDESALPALLKVQYSEVGQENWHDLIIVTRTQRKAISYKLLVGHSYDIRASADGGNSWPLRQNNYLIDSPAITLKVNADQYCK